MGRVTAQVTVSNPFQVDKTITFTALVDTGTSILVLPKAWGERLGSLAAATVAMMQVADQRMVEGEIAGPVKIQIEGFRPIFSEVAFLEMKPTNGQYEPLLGYIILEQSLAAVDPIGQRLIPVKYFDLK